LDALFKSKVLKQRDVASIALACLGVGFLELGPTGDLVFTMGDLLCLGQTFAFGVGYWRLESESQKHSHNASRLVVGQLAAVAGGSAIYCFAELGIRDFPSVDQFVTWLGDPFIIGALLWTGLISTALALYLETVALKVVSARELTLLMTTISLWGALFGFLALGEVLTSSGMFGGALIMAGCVLGNLSPPSKEKSELSPLEGVGDQDFDIEAAP
jgi:drug/metabolite transporter (DMT)-like permease